MLGPLKELLFGCELGHLGLAFFLQIGQAIYSYLSSARVAAPECGLHLPEHINLVFDWLLLRPDYLESLISVVDKILYLFRELEQECLVLGVGGCYRKIRRFGAVNHLVNKILF